MLNSGFIRECVYAAGFSLCGIARSRSLPEHHARLISWLDNGRHGGLGYLERNLDKRTDPSCLVGGAKTVIVCAVNYKNPAFDQRWRGNAPKIASYAYMRDYHTVIKGMLSGALAHIKNSYPYVGGRCFTDSAPVLEKAWAVEAGLGWIGKNSLLITPQYGSFVLLGEIIIDAEADVYDEPFAGERCGTCTLCVDSCPVSAISPLRVIDAGRCISRHTIEKEAEGFVYDPALSRGWIFGCDGCQSCCPYNHRSPMCSDPALGLLIDPSKTTPDFWHNLSEIGFDSVFVASPLSRAGYKAISERIAVFSDTWMDSADEKQKGC